MGAESLRLLFPRNEPSGIPTFEPLFGGASISLLFPAEDKRRERRAGLRLRRATTRDSIIARRLPRPRFGRWSLAAALTWAATWEWPARSDPCGRSKGQPRTVPHRAVTSDPRRRRRLERARDHDLGFRQVVTSPLPLPSTICAEGGGPR